MTKPSRGLTSDGVVHDVAWSYHRPFGRTLCGIDVCTRDYLEGALADMHVVMRTANVLTCLWCVTETRSP
jgi:hypothetical protein